MQPRIFQRLRHLRQQMAVGSDGSVNRVAFALAVGNAQLRQLANQVRDARAQQRLTAGDADLLDPQPDKDFRQSQIFR